MIFRVRCVLLRCSDLASMEGVRPHVGGRVESDKMHCIGAVIIRACYGGYTLLLLRLMYFDFIMS